MIIFVYYNLNKLKSILSGLLFIFIISAGCKKAPEPDQLEAASSSQNLLNVSYGTHVRNSLDVYLPEQRDTRTSVILLHGAPGLGVINLPLQTWQNPGGIRAMQLSP